METCFYLCWVWEVIACSEVEVDFIASLFMFVYQMEQFNVCFFVRLKCLLLIRSPASIWICSYIYGNELLMRLLGVPFLQGRHTESCFSPCFGLGFCSTLPTMYILYIVLVQINVHIWSEPPGRVVQAWMRGCCSGDKYVLWMWHRAACSCLPEAPDFHLCSFSSWLLLSSSLLHPLCIIVLI